MGVAWCDAFSKAFLPAWVCNPKCNDRVRTGRSGRHRTACGGLALSFAPCGVEFRRKITTPAEGSKRFKTTAVDHSAIAVTGRVTTGITQDAGRCHTRPASFTTARSVTRHERASMRLTSVRGVLPERQSASRRGFETGCGDAGREGQHQDCVPFRPQRPDDEEQARATVIGAPKRPQLRPILSWLSTR